HRRYPQPPPGGAPQRGDGRAHRRRPVRGLPGGAGEPGGNLHPDDAAERGTAHHPRGGRMTMNAKPPLLEVRNMSVSYGHRPILRAVDLTLAAGQLLGIVGPSGAGKSTLLKAILSLIPM